MRTNFHGSLLVATLLVGCGAAAVVGCGKPGNSQPSFRLDAQNQDPDDYRLVGGEDEAAKKDKEKNIAGRKYVAEALEAMFGTPDRPYVFLESGLDLAKIFMASGPVGGLPQSEVEAQLLEFRKVEFELRPQIAPLEATAKAAEAELIKQQEPAKPTQAALAKARTALSDAEKANAKTPITDAEKAANQAIIDEQKRVIAGLQAEYKEKFEASVTKAEEAKAAADAAFGKASGQLADVMRQIGIWQKGQLGLYRQHCAHCHGTTGDGAGPTALFLNPYPRDYRLGIFKFKSTERAARPSHADLRRILVDGIPDSAMPTVGLLDSQQIDALVEYVKYLSMRGEVETLLRDAWTNSESGLAPRRSDLAETLQKVAQNWKDAESQVAKPGVTYQAAYDAWKQDELKRHRDKLKSENKPDAETAALSDQDFQARWHSGAAELFGGQKGQCYTCHGTTGLGDGRELTKPLFDDWNIKKKFRENRAQIDAYKAADEDENAARLERIMASWQLPEQQQFPRNLRLGRFRFGRAPIDIYRRIHAGINGTEMPNYAPLKLTPPEIWQLVDYVLLLPYLDANNRLIPGEHRSPAAGHGPGPAPGEHVRTGDRSTTSTEGQ
jgi:mono/diheme cytochrome c family protein